MSKENSGLETIELIVTLDAGSNVDEQSIDVLTRHILKEIRALEGTTVDLVKQEQPHNTKGNDLVTIGALAIVTLPTAIPALISLFQAWSLRAESRIVKITKQDGDHSVQVEFSSGTLTPDQLREYIDVLSRPKGRHTK